jgi:hypothetical protein
MIRRDQGCVPRQLNVILDWSGEAEQPAPTGNRQPLHAEFAASSFHLEMDGWLAHVSSAILPLLSCGTASPGFAEVATGHAFIQCVGG